jgi:hypothetical protein
MKSMSTLRLSLLSSETKCGKSLQHPILLSSLEIPQRPQIEEANKEAPAFSRIFKEMILVTSSEKPLLRTGKGTVAKKATVKLYDEEISAL